ncbi:hypothetical protein Tco_0059871 [Tanacetum coccineum]
MNGKVPYYTDIGLIWSLLVFIRSLVIWERVHDFQHGIESYQQKVNITAPTITFLGIEDHEIDPKFCDCNVNRVLEGLKSYNMMSSIDSTKRSHKDETELLEVVLKKILKKIEASKADEKMGMYEMEDHLDQEEKA